MEVLVSLPTWHVNLSMKGPILRDGNCGYQQGFPGSSMLENLLASAGDTGGMSLIPGSGRSTGEGNGIHSSILAWKIPWIFWWATVHGAEKHQTCLSTHTLVTKRKYNSKMQIFHRTLLTTCIMRSSYTGGNRAAESGWAGDSRQSAVFVTWRKGRCYSVGYLLPHPTPILGSILPSTLGPMEGKGSQTQSLEGADHALRVGDTGDRGLTLVLKFKGTKRAVKKTEVTAGISNEPWDQESVKVTQACVLPMDQTCLFYSCPGRFFRN